MKMFPVMQSGFVAFNETGLQRPDNSNIPKLMSSLNVQGRVADTRYFYNTEVKELYTDYMADTKSMLNMEFRERVIKATFNAFGSDNFKRWCDIQRNSPSVGRIHLDFLKDTLNYIKTGERRLSMVNWLGIISAEEYSTKLKWDLSEYFSSFSMGDILEGLPHSLVDLLVIWLGHPGGYSDLLMTLQIIFGDRYAKVAMGG